MNSVGEFQLAAAAAVILQSLEPHHQHRRKHANASKDLRVTFAVATRDDDDDDDGDDEQK